MDLTGRTLTAWTGLVVPTLEIYAGIFFATPVIFALGALAHRLCYRL
jgi:hypothetical protein